MTDLHGLKSDTKSGNESQKICIGHEEDLRIHGYEKSRFKTILINILYILTIGWARLCFHWYPHLHVYATHNRCPLQDATKLVITVYYQNKHKSHIVKNVKTISVKNFSRDEQGLAEKIKDRKLKISLDNGAQCEVLQYNAFWFKKQCYIWDTTENLFSKLVGLDKYVLCSDLHLENNQGLSKEEQCLRRIVYGNNEIVVPLQSIGVLFLLEVLNPFYIFQVFTLALWFTEGYVYYTGAIIIMSVFGITTSIIQTRKNQVNLRGTVTSSDIVRVQRASDIYENISSTELVPGDIIELPKHQATLMCDAVLLTGQCILNESMLTGESVPVTKTPLPARHVLYDAKECSHHTLYSGTTIIQTRCQGNTPVLARVIRTGHQTNKGTLVAAILYPPPADFKFDQDSYKFIAILAFIALCGFIYTVATKIARGAAVGDTMLKALDIITIAIPPALPATMTMGKLYAQSRLKQSQIYCINNRVINVAGSINCVCFDKTGTLTEDGLDMWAIVPCTKGVLGKADNDIKKLKDHPLFEGMLVCHSLTLIDNQLCGDPLDVKMFQSTGWTVEDCDSTHLEKYDFPVLQVVKPSKSDSFIQNMNTIPEIGIAHQYHFSSSLQRMSVIAHVLGTTSFKAYTKGAPEVICNLSKPETVPANILQSLKEYTKQGYRVIAMGCQIISEENSKVLKLTRDAVEKNLEFLGFVILENRLKKSTIPVIKELRDARIHVVMITGDNIQTAVSVAKECGILSPEEIVIDVTVVSDEHKGQPQLFFNAHDMPLKLTSQDKSSLIPVFKDIERGTSDINYRFALSGTTWHLLRKYYPDILPKICVRGAVFARMTSDEKQQLVLELMELGYYVVMCGDGANDCGALKAAHAGVSLSEAESSVASPFTSKIPDITCVPKVIREGRASLVTSFGIFKFMISYALTEFLSVIILYSIDSNLTDLEFLFIDICLIINFASIFGKTKAYDKKLVENIPMTSLLSFAPLFSLFANMVVVIAFQVMAYHLVRVQHELENDKLWPKLNKELPSVCMTPNVENHHNLNHKKDKSKSVDIIRSEKRERQEKYNNNRKHGIDNQCFMDDESIENIKLTSTA
ncbi:hypothetical protein KM043_011347 [Ampulex compressa]|nr:hypothetical protein KM043_011347 [Ampulex compressa]